MKISIDDLARFGMDRVGVQVVITPSDNGGKTLSVQVKTTPYTNNDVIAAVQSMVGDGLEDDMLVASAFMTSNGSLSCKGFTPTARGRLATVLGEFSNNYRKIIEFQAQSLDEGLRVVAREAAAFMLYNEPKDGFGVHLYFVTDLDDLDKHEEHKKEKREDGKLPCLFLDQLTRIIDNGDFLAWHHARLQKAIEPMVIEELRLQLPLARQELTERLAAFDRMAVKLDKLDDDRTNPAGVRRS